MFKNSILRYLNSAAVFDAESDAKAAIEEQRKNIKVDVANPESKEQEQEQQEEEKEENKEDNEEDEEKEEDEKDENNNENETEEQKQARLAKEKEDRAKTRMQRRIDKLTAERNLTREENNKLKKQLEEKPVEGLTEEEVQRRAEKLAADIVKERQQKDVETQFQKDCDKLQTAANKTDKEFDKKIAEVTQEIAKIPSVMIGILSDLDNENGGAVLSYLANNPEEYEGMFRIVGNEYKELSEGKMTQKLIRISDKLKAEEDARKSKKKDVSKVPPPITPVNEGRDSRTVDVLPKNPTQSMDEYVRIRNKQDADRRKARGY